MMDTSDMASHTLIVLAQILVLLVLGGLMGLLGQGSRAVAGLKKMSDDAKTLDVSSGDLFRAARLFVSLAIGFLVGLAAALIYLMGGPASPPDWHILLGFAAAGYAGTDFLEAFISKYLTSTPTAKIPGVRAGPAIAAAKPPPPPPALATAKDLVYSVMHELGNPSFQDSTSLQSLGYDDPASKDIIRGAINSRDWHGVDLPFNALAGCTFISDITDVVQKAVVS